MRENFPIAIALKADGRRSSLMERGVAVRQFFSPYVLAFLALAVTVGGWGYGAKLAQYSQHSNVTKPYATRMWVDHREDSSHVRAHAVLNPQRFQSQQFFGAAVSQLPHLSRELVLATPAKSRILTFVSPLHPLRAPPKSYSSLA